MLKFSFEIDVHIWFKNFLFKGLAFTYGYFVNSKHFRELEFWLDACYNFFLSANENVVSASASSFPAESSSNDLERLKNTDESTVIS